MRISLHPCTKCPFLFIMPILAFSNATSISCSNPTFAPWNTRTWTFHNAVAETQMYAVNTSSMTQTFWTETNPPVNHIQNEISYWGCAVLLENFPPLRERKNGSNSDGIFSANCYSSLVQAFNNNVQQVARGSFDSQTDVLIESACSVIAQTPVPQECKVAVGLRCGNLTRSALSPYFLDFDQSKNRPLLKLTQRLVAFLGILPSKTSTSATQYSQVFNRGQESSFLQVIHPATKLIDCSTYSDFIRRPNPVVLSLWSKSDPAITMVVPELIDTRLVCVTADHVQPGSRVASGNVQQSSHITNSGFSWMFDEM